MACLLHYKRAKWPYSIATHRIFPSLPWYKGPSSVVCSVLNSKGHSRVQLLFFHEVFTKLRFLAQVLIKVASHECSSLRFCPFSAISVFVSSIVNIRQRYLTTSDSIDRVSIHATHGAYSMDGLWANEVALLSDYTIGVVVPWYIHSGDLLA